MYSFMQHNGAVDSIYIGHFAVLGQGGINIEIRNILHGKKVCKCKFVECEVCFEGKC